MTEAVARVATTHPMEQAWSVTLRADGPEYVPLRTFRDDDLLDPGSDPSHFRALDWA